jgi:hypothetical protein
VVDLRICGLQQPTQDGGRYGSIVDNTSLTLLRQTKLLMSIKVKMLKDKKLSSGRDTTVPIRDGELSIKTSIPSSEVKVTARNSDSISEDHSILDQECH